ncbi:MAG: class B sortase, partial [Oscillospiraceae bacterium]|nr:class B sortase [Oscillospiraceae bacterium]
MKRALILAASALLIALGCWCGRRYYREKVLPEKRLDEANEKQLQLFRDVKPGVHIPEESQNGSTEAAECDPLEDAEAVNSTVAGWLTVPGTHIDYPVCQAEDNDFYLHNGFDGKYNHELGCPFLDYRCEPDFSGFNSIVYAHHMTRRRMFADIALYKEEAFLRAHPSGTLTLHDGVHDIRFFAYLSVPGNAPAYHTVFVTDSERQEYLDYLLDTAAYCTLEAA